jgi:hypothetical protein
VNVSGWSVVVFGGNRQVLAPDVATGEPKAIEGLRRSDLVDQVKVDVQKVGRAIFTLDHQVVTPKLFSQG